MTSVLLFFAALLGLGAWLAPNHYPPWASFHSEFMMAAAGLLVLPTVFRRARPATASLTPLLAGALALSLVPLLQAALGMTSFAGDAWMAFIYLLGFALAVWTGQRLCALHGRQAVLERFMGVVLVAVMVSMGLALYQWLSLSGLGIYAANLPPGGRPFANLGQPNHLSTLLFMGLVGGLYLYEIGRLGPWVTALLCVFLEFGLAMTTSRTAWLAMTALVVALWFFQRRAALRLSRAALVGIAIVFIAWLWLWPVLNDALLLSSGRTFSNQTASDPRAVLWGTAIEAIQREPWLGYGWNQGLVAQSQVVIDQPAGGRLIDSYHNLLLDLLIWNGVPLGAAVFGGLLWWGWRRLARAQDATAVMVLIALLGVFAHTMVELPLSFAYFLLPVGLLMGLLDECAAPVAGPRLPQAVVGMLAAGLAGLVALVVADYLQVEDNTRVLRFETARIGTAVITSEAPQLRLLTQWGAYLKFARLEPRAGLSADELAWMGRVTERYPYANAQFNLALALGLNGQPDAAALNLRRLCSLHSARRCSERLAEWRDLVQTRHPQLASIPLPKPR
jgi:O-antigen ligase